MSDCLRPSGLLCSLSQTCEWRQGGGNGMSPWLLPWRLMLCLLCPASQRPRIISLFIIQFLIIKGRLNPAWYTANPDYDITRLICSYSLTLNRACRCTHWKGQTFLKETSKMNLFPFTASAKSKGDEEWSVRDDVWWCSGTRRGGKLSWCQTN